MIRHECLESLAAKMSDQLVVTSQSGQRIEWSHLSKHEGNLLVGMMGCAIGVATGLALALPHRKVIALDSDGSVLLSLFNLATLGNLRPKNLVIYVSSYSLLVTGKQLGVPVLLVVGFLGGVPDQRNSFLYATIGNHTIPVLQGLGIEHQVLEDGEKLEIKISDAVRAANALRAPYALLFAGEFSE